MLGVDSNRAIGPANDGSWVVERIGAAEIDDESGVLGTGHESYAGANFNAECFVGLGVRNARRRGRVGTPASPDVDGTGSGSGSTRVRCRTNTCGIRCRADITLDFLLSVLAG